MASSKSFRVRITQDEKSGGCAIVLPFDPKAVFGKVRAPVTATISGAHTFRTTIFRMKGVDFIPLRKSNRAAADVEPGQTVDVTLALDDGPRVVTPPEDLVRAMRRAKGARAAWDALSYTRQREWAESIEEAKRAETRQRRIAKCVGALVGGP